MKRASSNRPTELNAKQSAGIANNIRKLLYEVQIRKIGNGVRQIPRR